MLRRPAGEVPLQRGRPSSLRLGDGAVDRRRRPRPRSEAALPPVRPIDARPARRPPPPAAERRRRSSGRTETTTRDADSPNSVATQRRRDRPPRLGVPRQCRPSTPMPPVSNAALGERDRQPAVGAVVRGSRSGRAAASSTSSAMQRALARRGRARRHRRAPGRARSSGTRCRRARRGSRRAARCRRRRRWNARRQHAGRRPRSGRRRR